MPDEHTNEQGTKRVSPPKEACRSACIKSILAHTDVFTRIRHVSYGMYGGWYADRIAES